MKARIDTVSKTIGIDEPITLDELTKFVKALFPNEWKEWKVDTNVKVEMKTAPIIVERYPSQPWGPYWYGGTSLEHNGPNTEPGVYCLQTQN